MGGIAFLRTLTIPPLGTRQTVYLSPPHATHPCLTVFEFSEKKPINAIRPTWSLSMIRKIPAVLGLLVVLGAPTVASSQSRPSGTCPGRVLAYSCGNGSCQSGLGETTSSCPQDCVSAPIKSYNNFKACTGVDAVYSPSSASAVSSRISAARSSGRRVKFSGARHTISDAICTSGVVLKSKNLDQIYGLETFENEQVVRVGSGVVLGDLTEWLHQRNRSLGYAVMGYRLGTIGGQVATGSHGSSPKHDSVLASRVRWIQLVDDEGNIREFSRGTTPETQWRALTANAGLLGMMTELRLSVASQFKLDVSVTYHNESSLFDQGGALEEVDHCDFALINWFPRTGKYVKTCGVATSKSVDSGAENVLLNPAPGIEGGTGIVRNHWQNAACDREFARTVESAQYTSMKTSPPFSKDGLCCGAKVRSKDLVGYSQRMMSSAFAAQGDEIVNIDWEIAVPEQYVHSALSAARSILAANNASVWEVGVLIRFTKVSKSSWLANTAAGGGFHEGDIAMYIEMPVIEPIDFAGSWLNWYEAPYKEVVEALIRSHGGRPHLGKNKRWAFELLRDHGDFGANVSGFNNGLESLGIGERFKNSFGTQLGIVFPSGDGGGDDGGGGGGDDGGGSSGDFTNGETKSISGSQGSQTRYEVTIPSGASGFSVEMSGGSGDADLYVKKGSAPTTSDYQCRPYKTGNNESCPGSGDGTFHIMVNGYSAYSGTSLTVSWTEPSGGGGDGGGGDDGGDDGGGGGGGGGGDDGGGSSGDFTNGETKSISGSQGSQTRYEVTIPSGASGFSVEMSGGSGDADLYVKKGSAPTTSDYQCRPYKTGNNESCPGSGDGTFHIMVNGYSAYSGTSLTVSWTEP